MFITLWNKWFYLVIHRKGKWNRKMKLTMVPSLMGLVSAWSNCAWRGMKADPTSFSNRENWSLPEPEVEAEEVSATAAHLSAAVRLCARMRLRILCHRRGALLPILSNISSGMGTSNTVSKPPSLSKFGHNFRMFTIRRQGCAATPCRNLELI